MPMSSFWNETRIDFLNIALMGVSLVCAFILPFELFLFAYAVLGPLHYLTEISWLDKHEYFIGKRWWALLCSLTAIIVAASAWWSHVALERFSLVAVFFPFFLALILVIFKKQMRWQLAAAFVLLLASLYIAVANVELLLFTLFIPTILHVFVFTLFFMLNGALKRSSRSGYASAAVLCICVLIIGMSSSWENIPYVSEAVRLALLEFSGLNLALIQGVLEFSFTTTDSSVAYMLFESNIGVLVMRFIAFAYTYHYLNWFSKTSIIGWHQTQLWKLAVVVALWVAAVSIYAIDYITGFKVLLFMSILHVLLEFPLNHQSFIGVAQQIRLKIKGINS